MTASTISGFSLSAKTRFLELLTLSTLAVSAPLLGVLAEGPEFFINLRASRLDILFFVAVVCVALPFTLWILEQLLSIIGKTYSAGVHHIFTLLLCLFLFTPIATRHWGMTGIGALVAAAALSLVVLGIKIRFTWVSKLLSIFWPITLVVPLFFLANSGISSLLLPKAREKLAVYSNEKSTTPVVLVVFDEFSLSVLLDSNQKIDALRFPNIAAFAAQSHWFKNATSINQFTPLAVPAILSGRFPASSKQLPTIETYPVNLFTALAGTHELKVYEPFTRLCPPELCGRRSEAQPARGLRLRSMFKDVAAIYLNIVVPIDLNLGVPDIDGKWGDFWSEDEQEWEPPNFSRDGRVQEFQRYINSLSSTERPGLYFAHIVLPHMPYQFMPSGKSYRKSGPRAYLQNRWIDDPALIQIAYQQYLLQVGATDKLFGKLIHKLKDIGIYDQALVILVADHGVSFQVGTYRRGHPKHPSFYEDILSVPFIIKLPNQKEGVTDEKNVETIDVLPTILDSLHMNALPQADGISVFSSTAPKRKEKSVLIGRIPEGKVKRTDHVADWGKDLAGTTLKFEYPSEFPHATLDWKLALPGYLKPNSVNPYYIGPHIELLGRNIAELKRNKAADGKFKLFDRRSPLDENGVVVIRKDSSTCPCSLSGVVFGANLKAGTDIAVSVNGVLQAFGTLMSSDANPEPNFAVFLNDSAFQEGPNKVEFFAVEGVGAEFVLSQLSAN